MDLKLAGLRKTFGTIVALDHVDLEIASGEFVCFLGPSGCGKTTLLRIIAGLETADAGAIRVAGRDIARVPARHRNFGMVFQSYSLFPNLTVAKNVAYGLECRRRPRAEIERRVAEVLSLVHLADQARKLPAQLSGGQQQRVALARALAPQPAALLLDEPLSALDAKVRDTLRGEIRDLQRQLGITTVMVTHDQDEAMEMADRIVVMDRGRIRQVGSAADLYHRPANRFVAEFIGRINLIRHRGAERRLICVRPEEIEVVPPGASAAGPRDGALTGAVRKVVFLGNVQRLSVEVDGQIVLVDLPGRHPQLPLDATVGLRLPRDALAVPAED